MTNNYNKMSLLDVSRARKDVKERELRYHGQNRLSEDVTNK